jgi:hypothetical protein
MQPISEAREKGFKDDEILAFLQQKDPALEEPINKALQTGFSSTEVLDYINIAGLTVLRKGQQVKPTSVDQPQQERGIIPSLRRGFGQSVSGLVTGSPERVSPEDQTFTESLAELTGSLVGDVPAMFAGGAAGATAGTAVFPGPGTVVGAGAGSFALPQIIKQSFAEYRDYAKGGGAGTFGEFLERIGRTGKAGVKGAALGAVTSQASKLLPVLKRMPRFAKLLNTRLGKALEEPAAELAALTTGEAALEGKFPTAEDVGKNVFAIAGFRLSKAGLGKAGELAKKYTPFEAAARIAPMKELERMKQTDQPKENIDILNREIRKRESAAKAREKVTESIKSAGIDLAKKANSLLPERLQETNKNIVEDISQRIEKRQSAAHKKKINEFTNMLEKHVGKKSADMLRSHFKWSEALETPIDKVDGKDIFLSDENLSDMMYYRQKTKNPNVKADTFEALSERLPKKAKTIVDDVVDDHFKTWLKRWNDNPATLRKISPREGLEDIYLPGIYKETSKSKYSEAAKKADEFMKNHPDKTIRKQFKLNGPFVNAKVFENYAEAFEKGGLTPRYDNLKDLLRYHDEMMIRLEANSELMSKIRKWQKENGEKVFVNSNNKEAYEKAKKDGWIPFEDKFLRMRVAGKDEAGKPKWELSPDRALVDPAFAKVFQGIFNKNAYSPDHPFWKFYDAAGNLMKVARVSLSPFHIVALAESGIGGLGIDFFKGVGPLRKFFSENWWDEASKKLGDIDGLAWRAEMGLNFNVPDKATYEQGQKLLDDVAKTIPNKENLLKMPFKKAAKAIQKSHKWIFQEYQPRLKIATFDSYLKNVLEGMAKEGKEITPELTEKAARDIADVVNNQFGGQIFETMTTMDLNDPKVQKWLRRVVGYPDWSISALKQATNAIAPGIKGEVAREYWVRYLSAWMSATYLMRFLYGGLSNKEGEKNKFTWDPKKAYKSLDTKDPNQLLEFPLPDVNLEIAGVKFNPGRDEKGRRLHAGFGKQAKEIPRYVTDPLDSIFGKANPLLTAAFKQLFGITPYKGEAFPVRGKFKAGSFMPWDATLKGSPSRALSHISELAGEFLPFSFRGIGDKGIATTLATGIGAIPVRKSLSLKASEPYIYDALRNKNLRKLKQLISVLKDGGYTDKQIKNRVRLIKKSWIPNEQLDSIARSIEKK